MSARTICVAGPPKSGKSSLIYTLTKMRFPAFEAYDYDSGSFHGDCEFVEFNGFLLKFKDTFSKQNGHHYRGETISVVEDCDIHIICIDISDVQSLKEFQRIKTDIEHYSRNDAGIILIGCKSDLRDFNVINTPDGDSTIQPDFISIEKCKELCHEMNAVMYMEFSAKTAEIKQIEELLQKVIDFITWTNSNNNFVGYRLPKSVNGNYSIKPGVDKLLIYGFMNAIAAELQISHEIKMLVHQFYYIPRLYFYDNYQTKTSFSDENLRRNFWIMHWADLSAILLHNIGWLCFGIQLFMEHGGVIGRAALVFSIFESAIIFAGYVLLWCYDKIEYYTHGMMILHLAMEMLVNLPMIIILLVYYYMERRDFVGMFYFALATYLIYGLYKIVSIGIFWSLKNQINKEKCWVYWMAINAVIWMIQILSMIVIGSVFI